MSCPARIRWITCLRVWGSEMSDFAGMEELMQDFLTEAYDLLAEVDGKLIDLEKSPDDRALLNVIFRGFHTIKGGAGFLNATELVTLCHLTENLFDKLRNGELALDAGIMDVILAATGEVRQMFGSLAQSRQPESAPAELIAALHATLKGEQPVAATVQQTAKPVAAAPAASPSPSAPSPGSTNQPDWNALYQAVVGVPAAAAEKTE